MEHLSGPLRRQWNRRHGDALETDAHLYRRKVVRGAKWTRRWLSPGRSLILCSSPAWPRKSTFFYNNGVFFTDTASVLGRRFMCLTCTEKVQNFKGKYIAGLTVPPWLPWVRNCKFAVTRALGIQSRWPCSFVPFRWKWTYSENRHTPPPSSPHRSIENVQMSRLQMWKSETSNSHALCMCTRWGRTVNVKYLIHLCYNAVLCLTTTFVKHDVENAYAFDISRTWHSLILKIKKRHWEH